MGDKSENIADVGRAVHFVDHAAKDGENARL